MSLALAEEEKGFPKPRFEDRDYILFRSGALHEAKLEIKRTQQAATNAMFAMFDCVRDLRNEHFEAFHEVEAWLTIECGISEEDVAIYESFERTLGVHRDLLADRGVAFETVKALVRTDPETRARAIDILEAANPLSPSLIRSMARDTKFDRMGQLQRRSREQKLFFRRKIHEQGRIVVDGLQWEAKELLSIMEARLESIAHCHDEIELDKVAASTAPVLRDIAERAKRLIGHLDNIGAAASVDVEDWLTVGLTDPVAQNLAEARHALHIVASSPTCSLDFEVYASGDYSWSVYDGLFHLTGQPLSKYARKTARAGGEKLKSLEICAGIGGEAIGLMAAGFEAVALVDNKGQTVETLKANWPKWPAKECSITLPQGRDEILSHKEPLDLLAGGVPCQPFSRGGKHEGEFDDRQLFGSAADYVRELRPRAFAFENVMGFTNRMHTDFRRRLQSEFASLGYRVHLFKMQARDYGLAQKRQRAVLVGLRHGYARQFRPPTLSRPIHRNFADTVVDLVFPYRSPPGTQDRSPQQIAYDTFADGWVEIYGHNVAPTLVGASPKFDGRDKVWNDIGFKMDLRAEPMALTDIPLFDPIDIKRVLKANLPWKTPPLLRRLQGIPDEWVVHEESKLGEVELLIANAFPPVMARAVGLRIREALTGEPQDLDAAMAEPVISASMIGGRPEIFNIDMARMRFSIPRPPSETAARWNRHIVSEREQAEGEYYSGL